MSLQYAAQHLAAKGRGPDTMLVHMAPSEVRGLQAIAMAHGGSLSINPETGLPEAGFLSSILPTIIGAGLSMIPGVGPLMAAGIVGGGTALATGSLEKGLMAGLGAYGGAGLAGSIAGTGASAITAGADAAAAGAGAGVGAGADTASQFMLEGARPDVLMASPPPPAYLQGMVDPYGGFPSTSSAAIPANPAVSAVPITPTMPTMPQQPVLQPADYRNQMDIMSDRAAALREAGPSGQFKAGLTEIGKDPSKLFKMDNLKYGLAAAAPILGATPETKGIPTDDTARIRDYVYDPISGTYQYIGARTPSEVAEQGPIRRAADGGVMRYGNGGPTEEQLQTVSNLYSNIGRTGDTEGVDYWANRLAKGESVDELTNAFNASAQYVQQQQQQPIVPAASVASAAPITSISDLPMAADTGSSAVTTASAAPAAPNADQLRAITDIYRNTLGRDPDAEGLNYWAGRLAQGESIGDVYGALQGSARYVLGSDADRLAPGLSSTLREATTPYIGFKSADPTSIGDEWVRNVLGREATAADRALPWYQSLGEMTTTGDTTTAYNQFLETYGLKDKATPSWFEASQLRAPKLIKPVTTAATTGGLPGYTFDPTATVGSGLIRPQEPMGLTTDWTPSATSKKEPLVPTMQDVVNAYTKGGGLTGRLPYVPKSLAEQEALYNRLTGESSRAYDYLMGRGKYPRSPAVAEIMRPYGEAVLGLPAGTYNQKLIFDPVTQQYIPNPKYKAPVDPGAVAREKAEKDAAAAATNAAAIQTGVSDGGFAQGGITAGAYHLGDYSDGGRLLKGPGDGVSDSIPATIGGKRPARLADGEFVVPARIVSELGNGSTEAGARKLYAMMNRIQNNRRKSVGKGKVAVNSKSDKYLPA